MILRRNLLAAAVLSLAHATAAVELLRTNGFSTCQPNSTIQVTRSDVSFDRDNNILTFDVAGSNAVAQMVQASIVVTAYGRQVYQNSFNPCDQNITQLCPVPSGNFSARGTFPIPSQFVSQIPAIAFQIPDLDGLVRLELKSANNSEPLACLVSTVTNGKTANVPAVGAVTGVIAGAALIASGLTALSSAGGAGGGGYGPSFAAVMGWFQSMAMNGMMSVDYPPIYRSFTKNFGWSTGLITWPSLQRSIDDFRAKTGGNLTNNSFDTLQNTTLVFTDPNSVANLTKRGLEPLSDPVSFIMRRAIETSVNGQTTNIGGSVNSTANTQTNTKNVKFVDGVKAYSEQLQVPDDNTFMTILIAFAIAIAAIIVGILLFKVILEAWALCASFPEKLTGFRKRYWGLTFRTIVNLILILYGVWTLWSVYIFANGDAWGPKLLAGVTLALFTALLAGFSWKIWSLARKQRANKDQDFALYDNKKVWINYSLFYDQYKRRVWWIFIPTIVYSFTKGCIIAGANGHGLVQVGGQLIVEALFLTLLVWYRPFETKAGNWINIVIQVVRVISAACILIFVDQLGIKSTAKTITGVALLIVQGVLTAALFILILVNAIIICCKENPHRKKRKEAEQRRKAEMENLTSLDVRSSLLEQEHTAYQPVYGPTVPTSDSRGAYQSTPVKDTFEHTRSISNDSFSQPFLAHQRQASRDQLLGGAAPMGDRQAYNRQASNYSGYSTGPIYENQVLKG